MTTTEMPTAATQPFMQGYRAVDCTLTLSEELPCTWPGHMQYQHKTFTWYERHTSPSCGVTPHRVDAPYQTRWFLIDEHCGSHIDAPSHFIPPPDSGLDQASELGAVSVDLVPLSQLMGPAAVIDVSELSGEAGPGDSPRIMPEHVAGWESEHGQLDGEIVLFTSGWDENYKRLPDGDDYAENPLRFGSVTAWVAPDPSTIQLLLDRDVRTIGTDGTSMGPAEDGAPAHHVGLGAGAVFLEALTNLSGLPPRGASFLFLPLKIERGSGAPGRAVAFVPEGG